MPKPRKGHLVHCTHFAWRLIKRRGVWYADGRSNSVDGGRHSLGVKNELEARAMLPELDRVRAEDLGLIPRGEPRKNKGQTLALTEGRRLYEQHIGRSRVTGGVRSATKKRYRAIFDKFTPFASCEGVTAWNGVTADLLNRYAAHLESQGYAHKTIETELTTLKQAVKWLINSRHLTGTETIQLAVRKASSVPAYCYRQSEVAAITVHCLGKPSLRWLYEVIVALACTGLRIGELASLRWSDIDLESGMLTLRDETGQSLPDSQARRQLKSGRSRSFPVHPELQAVLEQIPRVDGCVFHGPRGGRLKPDTVRRIFVREVIEPLTTKFPTPKGERGFKDGRLHSFRHYFCSTCANNNVPERMVMDWLGHADSEMIRHYYHLHDEEAKRRMENLDFLGQSSGRSAGKAENND